MKDAGSVVCFDGQDVPLVRHQTYFCNLNHGWYPFVPVSVANRGTAAIRLDVDESAQLSRKCAPAIR